MPVLHPGHKQFLDQGSLLLEKISTLEMRLWFQQNKDYMKAYREANKDKIKAYREANKDKIAETKKAYYEANKDKIAEKKGASK